MEYDLSNKMQVLIESDWNLKVNPHRSQATLHLCINRIRLEFKVLKIITDSIEARRINRIRLEFKAPVFRDTFKTITVLIESDWNLKDAAGTQ